MRPAARRISCGVLALTGLCWPGAAASSSATLQPEETSATRASVETLSGATHVEFQSPPPTVTSSDRKAAAGVRDRKTDLERETGLSVSIEEISPVALTPGEPLTLSGAVTNFGSTHWRDVQVYLDIGTDPATTRPALTAFAESDTVVGTRILKYGLFAEIGRVPPGDASPYTLTLPFSRLPISDVSGVYHVGVGVVAQSQDPVRVEVARTDTLMPLLPDKVNKADKLTPTKVVTLIPLTAPVLRSSSGNFLDDSLAAAVSTGGRLSNVLQFAAQAPARSLQIVIDPALRDAVKDMASGYVVQTATEARRGRQGSPGSGQTAASDWLAALDAVAERQRLSLLAWGAPDASGLAAHQMPGVVDAGVMASRTYAASNQLNDALFGWQTNGASTRRGLLVNRRSGTSVQVVSEDSLTRLAPGDNYPPALVRLPSRLGPLTTLVVRSDVAGEPMVAGTSAIAFRQNLLAEATVRSLSDYPGAHCAVFAVPFRWDPGPAGGEVDLSGAYTYPSVETSTADRVSLRNPTPYVGPVEIATPRPPMSSGVLSAIASLRDHGRALTGILSDRKRATVDLNEQLGVAGSAAWKWHPRAGKAMIRQQAALLADQLSKVTVTGPTFVALSSKSGPFPLTVTNGLDVPITVQLNVKPQNPALKIEPIEAVALAAGQRRDVSVSVRADGSGVTPVRVRLTTLDDRPFGATWDFSVRTTQFGLVIWIAMGAGAAVLFGAAVLRIYRRIRESRGGARGLPGPA